MSDPPAPRPGAPAPWRPKGWPAPPRDPDATVLAADDGVPVDPGPPVDPTTSMPVPDPTMRVVLPPAPAYPPSLPPPGPYGHGPHPPAGPYGYGPHPPWGPPPAPPRRSAGRRFARGVAACGALLVAALVGAAVLSPRAREDGAPPATDVVVTAPPPTVPAPTTTVAASGPGRRIDRPAPAGTAVAGPKGWTVTVTGAELDADRTLAKASLLHRPAPGKRYVTVSVTVARGGGSPGSLIGEVKFSLQAPGGAARGAMFFNPLADRLDSGASVPSGGTLSGRLAFEVPTPEAARSVLLVEPLFTRDPVEDQRFLALR